MRLLKTKCQLDEVVKYIRQDLKFDAKCQGENKEKIDICNKILKEKDFEIAILIYKEKLNG